MYLCTDSSVTILNSIRLFQLSMCMCLAEFTSVTHCIIDKCFFLFCCFSSSSVNFLSVLTAFTDTKAVKFSLFSFISFCRFSVGSFLAVFSSDSTHSMMSVDDLAMSSFCPVVHSVFVSLLAL